MGPKMLVSVTQEDIDRGCRYKSTNCPVALAVIRTLVNDNIDVFVNQRTISLAPAETTETWWHEYSIACPRSVTRFVHAFDNGRPVKPFSFWLDPSKV